MLDQRILGCGELHLMGSSLLNLLICALKLSSLLKIITLVSASFGTLKFHLEPYPLRGDYFGIGFPLRRTYPGDKLSLTMICVPSVKAILNLLLICFSIVKKLCPCGGNSTPGLRRIELFTVGSWIISSSTPP